jgi:putative SOS response-associated peptidase YedK
MCGRFAQFSSLEKLIKYFHVDTVTCDVSARYNIAPTQEILAIIHHNENRLGKLHWGLVPSWAKDLAMGAKLINARIETVAQKPSFRAAFKRHRCLIPADGFYEWKGEKGHKEPWFISLPKMEPFAFAGLWETWKTREGNTYHSCTIITTAASASVFNIHDRMPVILKPDVYETWLDPENHDIEKLQSILYDYQVLEFRCYPVSKLVNSVKNDRMQCIEPLKSANS